MNRSDRINVLDNYLLLKQLFGRLGGGTTKFFTQKLRVSRSTFFKYIKYLREEGMNIRYNKTSRKYELVEDE